MKKVEAIIRTSKFEHVHKDLEEIGIGFMTFMDVKGYGLEHGITQRYRGAELNIGFIPRMMLNIVVPDDRLDELVDCLMKTASTGEVGDGKIFIYDVDDAYRIRNGDRGSHAI
jgi:nitrogen regulatory protein P-II 1